jgi:hypothetical protein
LSHLKIWFQPELKKNDFKQIQVTSWQKKFMGKN